MATSPAAGAGHRRVEEIDASIEKHRLRRQGNKVLHGYPPPLLWRERAVPVDEVMALRRRTAAAVPKRLILYVATPYCLPTRPERKDVELHGNEQIASSPASCSATGRSSTSTWATSSWRGASTTATSTTPRSTASTSAAAPPTSTRPTATSASSAWSAGSWERFRRAPRSPSKGSRSSSPATSSRR